MLCKKCGKEIEEGTAFCPYCGQDQSKDVSLEVREPLISAEDKEKFKESVKDAGEKVSAAYKDSDKLFSNIGDKMCHIAKIMFWIGAVFSIIGGLTMILGGFGYIRYSFGAFIAALIGGVLAAAVGILVSWLGSLSMYAFGELVRRTQSIDEKLK